jgi:hypothetical protein
MAEFRLAQNIASIYGVLMKALDSALHTEQVSAEASHLPKPPRPTDTTEIRPCTSSRTSALARWSSPWATPRTSW